MRACSHVVYSPPSPEEQSQGLLYFASACCPKLQTYVHQYIHPRLALNSSRQRGPSNLAWSASLIETLTLVRYDAFIIQRANPSGYASGPPQPAALAAHIHSRNVNRCVCKTFMARVASRESITHEMLISLAPAKKVAQLA